MKVIKNKFQFSLVLAGMALNLCLISSGWAQVRPEEAGVVPPQIPKKLEIRLGEGQAKKSIVAIPPLQFFGNPATTPQYLKLGAELYQVLQFNFEVSTYFQIMDQKAYLEDPARTGLRPAPGDPAGFSFEKWKTSGADFLVRGGFTLAKNELTLEIYIYSISQASLVLGKKYKGPVDSLSRLVHTFANDVLLELTGKEGMYLSRIVVSSDRGGDSFKEIYLMDWDGANPTPVSNHKSISFSPTWDHDAKTIAYSSFIQRKKTKTRNADLFLYELASKKRWLVSYRKGMNSGASFEPGGKHLLVTLSEKGSPDIFRLNLDGEIVDQLTRGPMGALNVEPAASPDGKKFAFSSDRAGQPMIYVANRDGSGVDRLTIQGKYNASPAWSPDGKLLAFSGWDDDHFDIFILDVATRKIEKVTKAKKANGRWANNEDPVFSPDGRLVMFTSNRTGKNQIFISDLQGKNEWPITSDQFNYFKPKWSKNQ